MKSSIKKPNIRFENYKEDWEQRKLGSITESFSGGTPLAGKSEYYGGEIPFIRSGEIASDSTELFLTDEGLNNSSAKMVEIGDILYALYGATSGEVSISRIHGAINQAILAIRPTQDDDSYVIVQWLKKQKETIISTYLQGGQGNLSGSIVKDLVITLPNNKDEQQRIGCFFKELDHLITLHQRKLDYLQIAKKTFLNKLFPKKEANTPEFRFSYFTDAWEQDKLEYNAVFSKGRGFSKSDLVDQGFPIILYGRMYTNYETIISNVDTYIVDNKGAILSEGNEVIVPASGESAEDISRASYVLNSGVSLGGDLNIIRPNQNINPVFLALNISNGSQKKEMMKRAQGKSIVHIRNSDLKEILLKFPTMQEQQQIGSLFECVDNLITLHQRKLEKYKELKKYYLKHMFV